MKIVGIQALITLISYVGFIGLAFWSIQDLHIERFIPMRAAQGKLLIVLLSVVIGYSTSSFFLSLIDNIRNLIFLVK
ncbi:DUF1146 family protein [Lentilactobacillus senioris]|uniref:DUF1146 domain-containing protein n=1 Tax=Lentilactobacillus senioris DSM 24302 = JCM 17472 TaxID=1423802 RepID=A0A0R2CRM3_9LACO|nr:DUF1146 family protein [Lentilactobacillus senioris]KRM93634.1 hypothetical protein FC56_GL000351 [Lentilactobacillus senioris DSM 24302 = JCM 17472]